MTVRVLVVDDSLFYRRRVTEALNAEEDIQVVGEAGNGLMALERVKELAPDVITMDINMPLMDGVTAVRRIMAERPTPILMFSSLTTQGARETLDALDAGALDFMPKQLEEVSSDRREALDQLCKRVRWLGKKGPHGRAGGPAKVPEVPPVVRDRALRPEARSHAPAQARTVKLVLIGTSTGGPVAIQTLLSQLPGDYPVPVLIVQHMPGPFTKAFAERMNKLCSCTVKEAQGGDRLAPGTVLIAPGGKQTVLHARGDAIVVEINDSIASDIYKPSVDVTFLSAADALPGGVLAVVLTGMGADGREGACRLKARNSRIWVQDEHSSVIFGMPKAIIDAGHADQVMSIDRIAAELAGLK
ncbi:MAG TPA: chemotaxis response regulator protein-glutamate methylesterase [Gammaproteobacteria bacterium]|nr:chemotaxis response regulator protein-glutamate methylesterase [Gammaproteobacteria bacterium]